MNGSVTRVGIADDIDSGNDERFAFGPESAKWRAASPGSVVLYFDDEAKPAKRSVEVGEVLAHFSGGKRLEQVAFFCHGHAKSLQTGHDVNASELSERAVSRLAQALAKSLAASGVVTLYACSCASDRVTPGEEFAHVLTYMIAMLRPDWKGWLDAHESAGHTTFNPMVYRYTPSFAGEAPGAVRKEALVPWLVVVDGKAKRPREVRERFARWRALLRTGYRFEYPRLTIEQIRARVP